MTEFRKINFSALNLLGKDELRRFDTELLKQIFERETNLDSILRRGISFGDNMDARVIRFTSDPVSGTQNTVPHSLGKIPTGYMVARRDTAANLYDGATDHDITNLYLKTDGASVTFTIVVF